MVWTRAARYLRLLEDRARALRGGPAQRTTRDEIGPFLRSLRIWPRARPVTSHGNARPPRWHDPGIHWVHRGHGWVAEARHPGNSEGGPGNGPSRPLRAVSQREIDGGTGGMLLIERHARDRMCAWKIQDVCSACLADGPWQSMERVRWVEDGVEDTLVLCPTCASGVPALACHQGRYVAGEAPGGDGLC